jgi:hypothetical protein
MLPRLFGIGWRLAQSWWRAETRWPFVMDRQPYPRSPPAPNLYIRAVREHYCPRPIVIGQIGQKFAPSCGDAHERLLRDGMRHPMFGAILIL